MNRKVIRFGPDNRADFYSVHCAHNRAGWCFCVAWWVPTWDGWGERSAADNRSLREDLLGRGEYDGYLLFVDGKPAGWCQVGQRDRLAKLTKQFGLVSDPETWAITCFLIAPAYRRQGLADFLLSAVLDDLPGRGARRVEAFPRRGKDMDDLDMWNGAEDMFLKAGFQVVLDDPQRPVLAKDLSRPE